jgi:hypothetical protein
MPSRRKGELILFSSDDPQPLVSFLVEKHGLRKVLELLAREHQPGGMRLASSKGSKKGGSKKGGKRGRPKGSKNGAEKGGKRGRKATSGGGAGEVGNGK